MPISRFPDIIDSYRLPPEIVGDVLEYEVEAILKQRVRKYEKGFRKTYLVHWKGYPSEEDSWEPRCVALTQTELIVVAYQLVSFLLKGLHTS